MYALDFEYDGRYLSDYGFVVCTFGGSTAYDMISAGSKVTFNTVPMHRGKQYALTGTVYDERISATFDIGKNPDIYEDLRVTNDEYRELMRWLNREEFLRFRMLGADADEMDTCYYNASFNVEKVLISKVLYGLKVTMETDRPFGYGRERRFTWNVASANGVHTVRDDSDEAGFIFPTVKITCKAAGLLTIKNDQFEEATSVKNCSNGEVITFDGTTQIITSSVGAHALYNDFNFEFPRIGNTFRKRENKISISLPCSVELKYSPLVKDTPE